MKKDDSQGTVFFKEFEVLYFAENKIPYFVDSEPDVKLPYKNEQSKTNVKQTGNNLEKIRLARRNMKILVLFRK